MPCYHPIAAFQVNPGLPPLFSRASYPRGARRIEVPCGQCIGCRLEYSRQWAVRCMHEAKMHDVNCFLTLTYDDEHLPYDYSLNPKHFTDFLKRLRSRLKDKVRFYMCGEYGDQYSRPHYHSAIFGFYPHDAEYWKTSPAGFKVYTSKFLDSVWGHGQVFIGQLTFESAAYIARYVVKKLKGEKVREIFDVTTGEVIFRTNEFGRMSLKPGLGSSYLRKYGRDVFMHDRVVSRGFEAAVPRYYDVVLERESPLLLAENKAKRRERSQAKMDRLYEERPDLWWSDPRRLDVEEVVKLASVKSLKRS